MTQAFENCRQSIRMQDRKVEPAEWLDSYQLNLDCFSQALREIVDRGESESDWLDDALVKDDRCIATELCTGFNTRAGENDEFYDKEDIQVAVDQSRFCVRDAHWRIFGLQDDAARLQDEMKKKAQSTRSALTSSTMSPTTNTPSSLSTSTHRGREPQSPEDFTKTVGDSISSRTTSLEVKTLVPTFPISFSANFELTTFFSEPTFHLLPVNEDSGVAASGRRVLAVRVWIILAYALSLYFLLHS